MTVTGMQRMEAIKLLDEGVELVVEYEGNTYGLKTLFHRPMKYRAELLGQDGGTDRLGVPSRNIWGIRRKGDTL